MPPWITPVVIGELFDNGPGMLTGAGLTPGCMAIGASGST